MKVIISIVNVHVYKSILKALNWFETYSDFKIAYELQQSLKHTAHAVADTLFFLLTRLSTILYRVS